MKLALSPTLAASGEGRPILARINCAEDDEDTVCNYDIRSFSLKCPSFG